MQEKLEKTISSKTMLAIHGFQSENIFLRKFYLKKCNSKSFCFLRKGVILKREHK